MVTISVFCNLKQPLLVCVIIIAHTVINHTERLFENIGLYNFNINHFAHFVPTDSP